MGVNHRLWASGLALSLAVGLTVFAAEAPGSADVKRITAAEAKAAIEQGKATLVDVRAKVAFDAEHAKGALSIPLAEITTRFAELPKDKLIIAYCT